MSAQLLHRASVDLQDFEEACGLLRRRGALHVSQQEVSVSDSGLEVLTFLQKLLQPFIESYQVLTHSHLHGIKVQQGAFDIIISNYSGIFVSR